MQRCGWVSQDQLYIDYHDKEWGVPETDGKKLFEMICLEGQQAGLSWITVLKKRENYRKAFHHFDPVAVAAMTDEDVEGWFWIPVSSAIAVKFRPLLVTRVLIWRWSKTANPSQLLSGRLWITSRR